VKLRHLAAITVSNVDKKSIEGETSVRLCNYMDVYNNARIGPDHDFAAATASPEQIRKFTLRAGDVLITKDSETPDDIGVPAYVTTDLPNVLCGYHLAMLRPRPSAVDGRYLYWAVAAEPTRRQFDASAFGITRFGLRLDAIADTTVPLPDLRAQGAIADFLDAETNRIDQLVVNRRRAIDLIDERFTSERDATVLQRLNPISGNGSIPDNWNVVALGVLIQLHRGFDLPTDEREDGEIPVISSGGISGLHSRAACEGPGVVTGRYGTIGDVTFVAGSYWPLNTTLFVSDFRGNDPKWVYHVLAVMPLEVDSDKSAVTGINRNVVGMLRAPKPPLSEQRFIATQLDRALEATEAAKSALARQIELLQERRQALITAAVTSQIPIPRVA